MDILEADDMTQKADYTNWTLMHKNIAVAKLEIIEETGWISQISDIFNLSHAPVGTVSANQTQIERTELNKWIKGRSIPENRQNLELLFETLDIFNGPALALKSYGLSLSDQYWLKPEGVNISWESINFFQNEFSDDIGEILFQNKDASDFSVDMSSPDNTLDGVLRKKWIIQNGKRILMKGSDDSTQQEPYNEVIASTIMSKLNIVHTPYTLTSLRGKTYSLCENFINKDTELITAGRIQNVMKRSLADDKYQHLLKCCEFLDIGDIGQQFEQMMVIDYIIANTDRHWRNFGFIRDANTLEYKGFAPIYDNGTSLWNKNQETTEITLSKTFKSTHNQQIQLIKDLSWYEPIPRQEITEIVTGILSKNKHMNQERIAAIAKAVNQKAAFITSLKKERSPLIIPVKKNS